MVGGVLLVIAALGYVIPIDSGYSIPQVVALCNSGMSQFGQSLSGDFVKSCSEFNGLLIGVYGSGVLGVILMIAGLLNEIKLSKSGSKKDKTDME